MLLSSPELLIFQCKCLLRCEVAVSGGFSGRWRSLVAESRLQSFSETSNELRRKVQARQETRVVASRTQANPNPVNRRCIN